MERNPHVQPQYLRRLAGRPLTGKEREVLEMVADGYTDQRIAEELALTTYTVKALQQQIRAKLRTGNRAGAVAAAVRARQLVLPPLGQAPLPPAPLPPLRRRRRALT